MVIIVTGSGGLVGSECVIFFSELGYDVVGIDNDMRRYFFGSEASTEWKSRELEKKYNKYTHFEVDIRDRDSIGNIFRKYNLDIKLVIHTAAQPSHDWAAREPIVDFDVNAIGTLVLLESTRKFCPDAVFIFTSTNKVYGDLPNFLPLNELKTRWEIDQKHKFFKGIDESMSVDQSKHSLFGASKVAADILVQEYARYFRMKTVCFRGGCLTGPNHSATELHGFLSYLMKCATTGQKYTIYGYKGKQVRDNIHSFDLINAFYHFYKNPRNGDVYNIGGSRFSNCSVLEAIELCEEITGNKMNLKYDENNRIGDHLWWISDISKFKKHYPRWKLIYNIYDILRDIYLQNAEYWRME